ncbi:MAG: RDD family protein [Rhodocyclaceae bacterium]|nr:RDD family protein [Rhodocyclaceae bacterium]MBK9623825.1 RDD family protein [Rhodocyclaceae bacterium]MBL0075426.1 RDD family protein [Rhodocyclaceae bacterium]MBP6108554.1 RDD family protein [Rhodocyclaceae bacterium]MBP6278651.1 RDD family protein [Rhodocyclaceae bacterium]
MREVATLRRRLASMVYESLLLIGVLAAGLIVPHLLLAWLAGAAIPGVWLWLHLFLLMGLYFIWCWRHGGQTLPMQTWKIKLIGVDDTTPSLSALSLRYSLAWPSLLFFGVGIVWALFDRDRQFLHDRLAATRIVIANDAPPTKATTRQPVKK